ncbi:small RNA 2'-O-methyltransferase isoform X2 [Xenopus laevis]|uniref:Small RNA 2'-O-methyltransferase n=1 Tax=Xenopus laevis TaxID=8355 RepID=A0A8J1MYK6_XENLA|nr:small RNA 2'-O-methyltransferase isoform X2 [Xenopus laevis]
MEPVVFKPPLYQQRYQFVKSYVDTYKPKKVADLGCSECALLHTLRFWDCIEVLVGLDIDEDVLRRKMHTLTPLAAHYLEPSKTSLTVNLYQGSVTQKDPALLGFDLITCIELIEHLKADDLADFREVLFGFMAPFTVIISTPNAEFNILLPKCTGFRHPDHKFEWNRREFQSWVEFTGVGEPLQDSKNVGFCSQIAVFTRNYTESEESLKRKMEYKSVYKTVLHAVYPSLQEEKYLRQAVQKVALFHAYQIKANFLQQFIPKEENEESHNTDTEDEEPHNTDNEHGHCMDLKLTSKWPTLPQTEQDENMEPFLQGDTLYVPLQKIFCVPKVKELCGNMDNLRTMITGEATLSTDGNAILYHVDLENSF